MFRPEFIRYLEMAAFAVAVLAGFASVWRLRRLKVQGLLPPEMATYFAPVTDGPIILIGGGFKGDNLSRNLSRMRQGRVLKLLIGREHVEIGDTWLTALVYTQRLSILALVVLFTVNLRLDY